MIENNSDSVLMSMGKLSFCQSYLALHETHRQKEVTACLGGSERWVSQHAASYITILFYFIMFFV